MRKEDENLEKCINTGMAEGSLLMVEEDHKELGVMTSRNGHICLQKRHCS